MYRYMCLYVSVYVPVQYAIPCDCRAVNVSKTARKHMFSSTHAYTHTHTHAHKHSHKHPRSHIQAHTHRHTHTHAHTNRHTHTHTHTQTLRKHQNIFKMVQNETAESIRVRRVGACAQNDTFSYGFAHFLLSAASGNITLHLYILYIHICRERRYRRYYWGESMRNATTTPQAQLVELLKDWVAHAYPYIYTYIYIYVYIYI